MWLLVACVLDSDGDGFLDVEDCGPKDALSWPGALEICDGVDNDCDGEVDEGFDLDGDGFYFEDAGCRAAGFPLDCDDNNAEINPDAPESCDGVDNNCSGIVDDLPDNDNDGVGACEDCDDRDPFASPKQPEVCDGLDNDCDGVVDEGWDGDGDGVAPCAGDCDDYDPANFEGNLEVCDGQDNNCDQHVDEGFDQDGDGVTVCRGDCDDNNPAVSPILVEVCDGVDNDCFPDTEEDGDNDGDGYSLCEGDCNDWVLSVGPGQPEICDDLDNDCDGFVESDPACWACREAGDYLLCSSIRTWPQANAACEAMGMDLVSIEAEEENTAVAGLVEGYLWLGLHDQEEEGTFIWSDGTPVSYTNWWSGEPNDYGGEDCASTNYGATGYWNDFPCDSTLVFACSL